MPCIEEEASDVRSRGFGPLESNQDEERMTADRRVLAWLAIASSALLTVPCGCVSGFVALSGAYSALDREFAWAVSDTLLFGAFFLVALVAGVVGLLFFAWGVRALLQRSPDPTAYDAGKFNRWP